MKRDGAGFVTSSNDAVEWATALAVLSAVGVFMMEYHRMWRGKPWSLDTANECTAIAGTACVSLALLFGRFNSVRLLRVRRTLGLTGVGALCVHGLACLLWFKKYDLQYYLENWVSFLLGVASLTGLLALVATSFPWALRRYGLAKWKHLQSWGYLLIVLGVTHFVVLGKLPAWLNWLQTLDRPAPPGTLIPFVLASSAICLKAVSICRRSRALLTGPPTTAAVQQQAQ